MDTSNPEQEHRPMMPALPPGMQAHKSTPQFSEASVPEGLLNEHSTKLGTWGVIRVESGQITYVITQAGHEAEHVLNPESPGVIVPGHKHHLKRTGPVRFCVEFYR